MHEIADFPQKNFARYYYYLLFTGRRGFNKLSPNIHHSFYHLSCVVKVSRGPNQRQPEEEIKTTSDEFDGHLRQETRLRQSVL